MGGKPGDALVHAVEGRQLDLHVVELAEVRQQVLVDIVLIVEDLEGAAGLRGQAALDRVLIEGQRHRLVRSRQRKSARPVLLAGLVGQGAAPQQGKGGGGQTSAAERLQQLASRDPLFPQLGEQPLALESIVNHLRLPSVPFVGSLPPSAKLRQQPPRARRLSAKAIPRSWLTVPGAAWPIAPRRQSCFWIFPAAPPRANREAYTQYSTQPDAAKSSHAGRHSRSHFTVDHHRSRVTAS